MDFDAIKGMMGSLPEPEWMKGPVKDVEIVEDLPTNFDAR